MPARTLDHILQAVALLSLVACGWATYSLFDAPSVGQVEAAEEAMGSRPVSGKKLAEVRKSLRRAEEELQKGQAHAQQLRERIPHVPDEAQFLKQLSGTAELTGLQIRDYRRGPVTVKESYSELRIDVTCSASYAEFCQFLEELDKLPRILTIDKLTVNVEDNEKEYPIELSLSVYFRGPREASEKQEPRDDG